jgi:regulator of sigma E protease
MSYILMILLIGALVVLHELGHLSVAMACGVKVERFGLGLPIGPTLWSKKIAGVEFCIHPLPFGGYVAFPDDTPDSDVPPDSIQRFENQSVINRAAIAIAGIAVNAVIGYGLMAFIIHHWGADFTPVEVYANRIAARPVTTAELLPAEAQANEPSVFWRSVPVNPVQSQASLVVGLAPYVLGSPQEQLTLVLPQSTSLPDGQSRALRLEGGPAAQAGLLAGDKIIAIDGHAVEGYYGQSFDAVKAQFKQAAGRALPITIDRAGKQSTLTLTPNNEGQAGVVLNPWADMQKVKGLSWGASLSSSVEFMHYIVRKNFEGLAQLATGGVSPSQLDGPIGIVAKGGQVIHQQGIEKGLLLTAIISMILAVMNLLPIPPLDGSLLMFLGIEAIKGSPLNKTVQERLSQVGFLGLMALMVFIVGNDIWKVMTGSIF